MFEKRLISAQMVVSNAHEKFGFLHISFYKIVQIVLPIILAVHKDAYAVYLGSKPGGEHEAQVEQRQREGYLPTRDTEGYACHHHNGRGERNDRCPDSFQ